MVTTAIERAARRIADARLEGALVTTLPADDAPRTEEDGYAIQAEVHRLLTEEGRGEIAGYKVAATAKTMQDYLGISAPCAAGMPANRVRVSGAAFVLAEFLGPGAECEIAVILARDLPASSAPYAGENVSDAVATCHAAMEVVDNRYDDFSALGAPTLIADDFFFAASVLGRPVAPGLDLAATRGAMTVNGTEVGSGFGSALLGHPYESLAWLANRLADVGRELKAGQVVMCGSVIPPVWLKDHGDGPYQVTVAFEGLGEARARFY